MTVCKNPSIDNPDLQWLRSFISGPEWHQVPRQWSRDLDREIDWWLATNCRGQYVVFPDFCALENAGDAALFLLTWC